MMLFWPMWYTKEDKKVCPVCWEMHGRVFPPLLYPPKPHPRCRCKPLLVPVWVGADGVPSFEPPDPAMPGWPDDEPEPIWDPGWLDDLGAEARRAWVLLVAYLLRTERPVPDSLLELVDEAEAYNREREDEDDPTAQADGEPWWWALLPEDEREEIEESELMQFFEDLDMRDQMSAPQAGERLALATGRVALAASPDRREYRCRFVRAGQIVTTDQRPGPFEIDAEALAGAVGRGLFESRPAFINHADGWTGPDLATMAGISFNATWNAAEAAVDGVIRLYPGPAGEAVGAIFDAMLSDAAAGIEPPNIGLSMVFWPDRWESSDEPDVPDRIMSIRYVESIDFVFSPAADGRILEALSTFKGANAMKPEDQLQNGAAGDAPDKATPPQNVQPVMPDWASAVARAAVPTILAATDLPQASRDRLAAGSYGTPAELVAAIDAERSYLAKLAEANVIQVGGQAPRGGGVQVGLSSMDQLTLAANALLAGVRPEQNIQPLTGIRELYHLLSGDYEMNGIFQPERVRFANVTSSTMAGLVANALNKRVVNSFMQYPQWWAPIVIEEDFQTLQDVRWITLGGVGELPTVAEGAAYTELTWDDQTETDAFVKKGGYLGLTLEAIDKDDTGRLRAAPRALAQAAWLTLSKAVSGIFTDNSGIGPTMADTGALFNATAVSTTGGHANLLTTALSHAQYQVVRLAMVKQAELNSGERLGSLTAPRFLLVPPDLEITALEIFATEMVPGAADYQENILAAGDGHNARMQAARKRVIVVDLWTDTNNWAAVADPLLYPSIGIGYRYGRTPEIFSVASPTAGLMFTNDTMPIKVRFFFAAGPTDWRGLHKSNVT